MKINLLITGSAYSTQSAYTAVSFAQAAVEQGHSIAQVFFYQDAVTQGSALSVPLDDEFDCNAAWLSFAQQTGAELFVCVSAAERRGVLGESQAIEFAKMTHNLHPQFKVAGLGVLHEAALSSERMVTFK